MRISPRKHMIDLIFPIILFFVFVSLAVILVVISADLYGRNTADIEAKGESRIALSYIMTKFRQNDRNGSISIGEKDDTPCLIFKEEGSTGDNYTYIYHYDNQLRELYVGAGVAWSLDDGTAIMPLSHLSMSESEEGLFTFETVDARKITCRITLGERSESDE